MFRFSLVLLTGLLAFSSATMAEQQLQLRANTSPPYADEKLPERGLALELVEHIYARTDYKPVITIESWSRAMEGVQMGVFDALAAAWYTPERNESLMFSEPYLSSKLIMVKSRKNTRNYRQLSDLAGHKLGVRTDYGYGVDFTSVPGLELVQENHLIQNLLNLLNGSVDFVIGDERTLNYQLNEFLKDRKHQFQVVSLQLPERARHVAASRDVKGHEEMVAAFNKALAESRKDGSYDAIVSKWNERYGQIK